MSKFTSLGCALIILSMSCSLAPAEPAKIGVLTCNTSASLGLILGSQQKLNCQFKSDTEDNLETYSGTINRLGVDLGIKGGGVMVWAVLAPTRGYNRGALAGKYVGASGDVSVGVGAGANVLIGGSNRSISLQPLSVSGNVGVNLALGVAGLTLQ